MKRVLIVMAVMALASGAAFAAVSALGGVLSFEAPAGWAYQGAQRERWLGDDPTCTLEKDFDTEISVTHYGLEGSNFPTPEEFEKHLDALFHGDDKKAGSISVSGAEAKVITLRYTSGGYYDNELGDMPVRNVYDEFVILRLPRGYIVFNLTIYRHEWEGDFDEEVGRVTEEWRDFLSSCILHS